MRITLVATVAALMLTPPAFGQDDTAAAARGAACSMVVDSLQRLTCFDRAFPKAEAATPEAATPPLSAGTGSWQVTREKSAIDDSPSVIAALAPNEPQSGGMFTKVLLVRCVENTTAVIIGTDDFDYGADFGKLTLRLDDAPATVERWAMSDGHSGMGLWSGAQAIPFLKKLREADRLAVRTELRKQVDMTFDLTGIDAVVDEIAVACNWPNT